MTSSCVIDDIEDLLKQDSKDFQNLNGDFEDANRYGNKSFILPYGLKKSKNLNDTELLAEIENIKNSNDTNIPGIASIYVKTWGCTHNSSDSEYMAGQLASYGYKIVDKPEEADLWLLNSCTVKNPAEDHFKNYIENAQKNKKYLVVAGCVPQGAPKADYIQGLSVIGVQQIDRIVEVVEETLKGNTVRLMGKKKRDNKKYGGASLNLPKVRRNPLIEIIAINTGCLNECTYCKTKHARGELGSYYPDEIVERVKQSFQEGVVEIWLTSEDTGAYGKDIGTNIVELLWKMIEHIPDGCMLRIGMTNPPYILEHLEQMALILNHPRVYSFLHIPIQSASDAVLADMKREYSSDDFRKIVDYLREKVPGVNILTDVICGFPTETEEDFEMTLDLIRQYKFSSLFINQFFQRPGTPAARMRQVPTQERKRRTRIVSDLFNSYTSYDHKIGERCKVLVTEISHDKEYYVAHNKFYEQVLVPKIDTLMGQMIEVEIVECGKFSMKAKLLENSFDFLQRPIETKRKELADMITNKINVTNKDKNNNNNRENGDSSSCCDSLNESSCCSNEDNSKKEKKQSNSGCCGENDNGCCSKNENLNSNTSVVKALPESNPAVQSKNNKLKDYATASLIALSAILISRIALKILYNSK